jgi:hypothetical protein
MGIAKYRSDISETQEDGAIVWRTKWWGGPSLAKIENCRIVTLAGDMRATVYVQGEADTFFSIPAKFSLMGKVLNAYLTSEDGQLVCHHCYY